MKVFAITPQHFTCKDVLKHLRAVKDHGASFLYLRSPLLLDSFEGLIQAVNASGMLPIVPFRSCKHIKKSPFGIHFKGSEAAFVSAGLGVTATVRTVSCHNDVCAVKILQDSADYVFVSPVFKPFSKQGDSRALFSRSGILELVKTFGERVVLLGGLNRERISVLQKEMQHDFSVAGITMFFGNRAGELE